MYYYGARYLDPRYSRWISADPALGEYIPKAPTDEEAKRHNQNLLGMGGVFNTVNTSLYHYAANNPVRYIDPDGNEIAVGTAIGVTFLALATYYTLLNYYQNPEVQEVDRQLAESASLGFEAAKEKIKNVFSKSKNKKDSEAKPADKPSPLPEDGAESGEKSKPQNKSPEGAGRKGALREAKRNSRVPTSQPPESQTPNYDKRGKLQPGRQYRYRDSEGNPVDIRDDSKGHEYPDDPNQNRGPHFNDEAGNHYDY